MIGDIETSGNKLQAPTALLGLFENFFNWEPVSPSSAKELARSTAGLCRLLRDEVTEQLSLKSAVFTELATDWRKLLFPDATDERFADGYARQSRSACSWPVRKTSSFRRVFSKLHLH